MAFNTNTAFAGALPLTPTLSPQERGEGEESAEPQPKYLSNTPR